MEEYSGSDPVSVLELESEGDEVVSSDSPVLLGKIVADFKQFHTRALGETLTRAWSLKHEVGINEVKDNMFVFHFANLSERERILKGSPWTFSGFLLCLKEWPPHLSLGALSFEEASIWIQVFGMTPNLMTKVKARRIGDALFTGVEEIDLLDDNTPFFGEFFRMRVRFKLGKPLPTGFLNKKLGECAEWVSFQYKNLGDYCYYCARVGHGEKDCPVFSEDRRRGRIRKSPIQGIHSLRATKSKPRKTFSQINAKPDQTPAANTADGAARGRQEHSKGKGIDADEGAPSDKPEKRDESKCKIDQFHPKIPTPSMDSKFPGRASHPELQEGKPKTTGSIRAHVKGVILHSQNVTKEASTCSHIDMPLTSPPHMRSEVHSFPVIESAPICNPNDSTCSAIDMAVVTDRQPHETS
ncbi:hypothetical protein Tsubulata_051017 [Turnera subulata]|uniref:CCHC-type domain-containing protein n=1 Tax=Turnera subulata TaxID=218843 RepID=A0A9Q0GF55_9ROSI|nr:hypothetical protein Tsubulata_051017 [Turnera subulata]